MNSKRLPSTFAAVFLFALASSCGGKAGQTHNGGSGGTQPGSGGSSSTGGTSSSRGSGGADMPCDDGCPAIGCGPGSYSVHLPGECCPTCVASCDGIECPQIKCQNGSHIPQGECCATCNPIVDCGNVLCTAADCPSGSHPEVPPGECCPQCVPDLTCEQGRAGLQALFDARTAELDAFSCTTTEECTVVGLGSLCKLDCGTAVNTASAETLSQELNEYGSTHCASCPQTGAACPPVVYFSECVENRCVLRP